MSRVLAAVAVVSALVLTTGCGDDSTAANAMTTPSEPHHLVATVVDPDVDVTLYTDPDTGSETETIPGTIGDDADGEAVPRSFAVHVDDSASGWVEVYAPTRPNGHTGWVHAKAVTVGFTTDRIHVHVTGRTIEIHADGQDWTGQVAVGAPDTPTPTGLTYVTEVVQSSDPVYGAWVLGLATHSEVLDQFAGGDGQVGIHGTSDPASIGQAVSHGCIRVPTDLEDALSRVDVGAPVLIEP